MLLFHRINVSGYGNPVEARCPLPHSHNMQQFQLHTAKLHKQQKVYAAAARHLPLSLIWGLIQTLINPNRP